MAQTCHMGDTASAGHDAAPAPEPGLHPPLPADDMAATRVVIVDDHALVREGTLQLLEQDPGIEVVGHAGTAEEGLSLLDQLGPDVAIVDINLPGMSGLDLARKAGERHRNVRILIVSAYDDYAYVAEALEVGVGGYMLKTATAKELLDAVHAVADDVFVLDRAVSGRLSRRWRAGETATKPLTPREADVLTLLAHGRSNKQIAAELSLGLRTIEGHVSNIFAKLGVASRTEAVAHAISHHLVSLDSNSLDSNDGPARSY